MTTGDEPLRLNSLDGRRVAVVLAVGGREVVCRGVASYHLDPVLGKVVRIALDQAAGQEIILSEADFEGSVEIDGRYGCDYCVQLG